MQEWRALCLNSGDSWVQLWDFKSVSPSFLPLRDTVSRVGDLHAKGAASYHFLSCSLTKNVISKMLTLKTLTNMLMKTKFQQVLIHVPFFAKDHCRLCHTVHRLIHSLEFQAHTWCDPRDLYLSLLCPLHAFYGLSTVRKCWLTLIIYLTTHKRDFIQPISKVAPAKN